MFIDVYLFNKQKEINLKIKDMANWIELKSAIELEIKNSNVNDKNTIKLIFNFERRLNSCRNILAKGGSWSTMTNSTSFNEGYFMLEDLKDNHSEWKKYADYNKLFGNVCIGDLLS